MNKKYLRQLYLKKRKNIINREILDNIIYNKVIKHEKIKLCKTILIYVSYNNEVDTIRLIKEFLKTKNVAVPKIENNKMNFYIIKNINELQKGKYNILEPITSYKVTDFTNTVSITPGICFSKDNYRIGYGKGYYDQFYQNHNVYKIGLSYNACLTDKIETNKFDQPVDELITDDLKDGKLYAYDFDKTIYDGDSSVDFYKYCLKKNKKICKYWFKQIRYFILYYFHIKTKTEMKEVFFSFLKDFNNQEQLVKDFWHTHKYKIKNWYFKRNHSQDIIISASPEFLLKIPSKHLKVFDLIASKVDIKNGKFLSNNCNKEEKVKRLLEKYPNIKIEEMYSDSYSDIPMLKYANKGYIVKKNKIELYK